MWLGTELVDRKTITFAERGYIYSANISSSSRSCEHLQEQNWPQQNSIIAYKNF